MSTEQYDGEQYSAAEMRAEWGEETLYADTRTPEQAFDDCVASLRHPSTSCVQTAKSAPFSVYKGNGIFDVYCLEALAVPTRRFTDPVEALRYAEIVGTVFRAGKEVGERGPGIEALCRKVDMLIGMVATGKAGG